MRYYEITYQKRISPNIAFCLDSPQNGYVIKNNILEFVGWVYCPDAEGMIIRLIQSDETLGSGALIEYRPGVAKRFGLERSNLTGFRFKVDCSHFDFQRELILSAMTPRQERKLYQIQLNEWAVDEQKRLFFMHIPKTAGSSTNKYLSIQCAPGKFKDHIEHLFDDPDTADTVLSNCSCISGHVRLGNKHLQRLVRSFNFYTATLLREPTEQLLSHLSWVKRLGLPEYQEAFNNHPSIIQNISKRLNSLDFKDFITSMTVHERNLFDNNQTRYLCGSSGNLKECHVQQALKNLQRLDVVGVNENYTAFLKALSKLMGWAPPKEIPKTNISSYRLQIRDLGVEPSHLEDLIKFDRIIYGKALHLSSELETLN